MTKTWIFEMENIINKVYVQDINVVDEADRVEDLGSSSEEDHLTGHRDKPLVQPGF